VADLSGFKIPFAAPFSASFVANYLHPKSIGSFNLNVAYHHGGKYYFSPDDGRGQSDPSLDKPMALLLVPTSNATGRAAKCIASTGKTMVCSVWTMEPAFMRATLGLLSITFNT
jgi:hypothetical protein